MAFREGDIVSIEAVVKYNAEDKEDVALSIKGSYETVFLSLRFVTITKPLFKIGDDVSWDSPSTVVGGGVILAIANEHAWIELGGGDYCTRMLSTLTRNEVKPDDE